jgi:hypothetical protein
LALKLSETTLPSADRTNFDAAVVPAFGAVVPVFLHFVYWQQQFHRQ